MPPSTYSETEYFKLKGPIGPELRSLLESQLYEYNSYYSSIEEIPNGGYEVNLESKGGIRFFQRNLINAYQYSTPSQWYLPPYINLQTGRFGLSRKKFKDLSINKRVQIIHDTFWFNKLKPVNKKRVYTLLSQGRPGYSRLKQFLMTTDSVILSLIFSFPEKFFSYHQTDKIAVSIMSNLLNSGDHFLKILKDFRKSLKKWYFTNDGSELMVPRELGVFSYVKGLTRNQSVFEVYKISLLCQTRSSGTGSKIMLTQAFEKWRQTVTTEYSFSDEVKEELDTQVHLLLSQAEIRSGTSRVSFGTSACYEVGQRQGGKWSILQTLFQQQKKVPVTDLETGEYTGNYIFPNYKNIGEYSFQYSLWRYKSGVPMNFCKGAFIKEPGKVRVVTSSQFFHATILHPFNHIGIDILKSVPCLRDGLSASKNLWALYKRIGRPFSPNLIGYCADLTAASDSGVRDFVTIVVRLMRQIFSLPTWYMNVVNQLLTMDRDVWFPELGERVISKRGWFMGDPGTKVILSVFTGILIRNIPISANCGDNIACLSCEDMEKRVRRLVSISGMELSEEDSFQSKYWINYCEEYLKVPHSEYELAVINKRYKDGSFLPYLDYPRFRLVFDLKKETQDHSSTPMGKFDLFNKEISWIDRGHIAYGHYNLLSVIQLRFLPEKEYAGRMFLPRKLGGAGKPPPFNVLDYVFIYLTKYPRYFEYHCKVITILNYAWKIKHKFQADKFSVTYNKHFRSESKLKIASNIAIQTARQICPNFHEPRLGSVYFSVCRMLADKGLLIPEKQVVSRIMYLNFVKEKLYGTITNDFEEDISSYEISLDKIIQESGLNVIKFNRLNAEVLLDNFCLQEIVSKLFYQTFYEESMYFELIRSYDILNVNLTNNKFTRVLEAKLVPLYNDLVKDKEIWVRDDFHPSLMKYKEEKLLYVDSDDHLYGYAKSIQKQVILIITDDIKLCKRIASLGHVVFRHPFYLGFFPFETIMVRTILFEYLIRSEIYSDKNLLRVSKNAIPVFFDDGNIEFNKLRFIIPSKRDYKSPDQIETSIEERQMFYRPPNGFPEKFRVFPLSEVSLIPVRNRFG